MLKQNADKYDFAGVFEGKERNLKDLNGEYKILYFGYLFCPDVCPTALATLGEVLNQIKRDDIKVLFITLDPERDTPQDLGEFARNFYQNSIGVRLADLDKTAKNYGVKFKKVDMPESAMGYSMAHSSAFYLLDKNGDFFGEVSNLTQEEISENILKMLAQRP